MVAAVVTVGWGMVPRGEVGLIFAMVVLLTTLLTPPVLALVIRCAQAKAATVAAAD